MENDRLLELARALLAQPTAPFHEDAVRGEILMQLAQFPHVAVEQDSFGNVIARYRRGVDLGCHAFAAHMDHPAYVFDAERMENGMPAPGLEFLGGVPEEFRAQGKTRDFGAFAMWDLPACEVRDGLIYSRACDDLIGCAAILALFDELETTEAEAHTYGLFTRAEEVGFIGAMHLAKSGRLPPHLTVISLECSAAQSGGASIGEGVVVRVGDRTSIFEDAATATLAQVATEAGLPFQRRLMTGGTCEATAYQLYGYRSAALCVALGNYHNCGPDTQIAPEFVSVEDVAGMVKLMAALVQRDPALDPHAALREKLEHRAATYARFY